MRSLSRQKACTIPQKYGRAPPQPKFWRRHCILLLVVVKMPLLTRSYSRGTWINRWLRCLSDDDQMSSLSWRRKSMTLRMDFECDVITRRQRSASDCSWIWALRTLFLSSPVHYNTAQTTRHHHHHHHHFQRRDVVTFCTARGEK